MSDSERKKINLYLFLDSVMQEVAAETMEGINGNKAYALPHKKVMKFLRKYGRVK